MGNDLGKTIEGSLQTTGGAIATGFTFGQKKQTIEFMKKGAKKTEEHGAKVHEVMMEKVYRPVGHSFTKQGIIGKAAVNTAEVGKMVVGEFKGTPPKEPVKGTSPRPQ